MINMSNKSTYMQNKKPISFDFISLDNIEEVFSKKQNNIYFLVFKPLKFHA